MTPSNPSLALFALLAAPAVLAQQVPVPKSAETMRPEITAARGIVAGGRNSSVAAGLRMLEHGGNAVDAGVAAVFAASV
ncbi:MAG TPA: gamma-glutamyltransferase, partial [Thermoanaerobaculia bacterium]|nr:gamma-glutamyltransferase [Thermoanaerobaculia bacterium]